MFRLFFQRAAPYIAAETMELFSYLGAACRPVRETSEYVRIFNKRYKRVGHLFQQSAQFRDGPLHRLGAKLRILYVTRNEQAAPLQLTDGDLKQIEQAIPPDAVAGTRYDESQMKVLDSER